MSSISNRRLVEELKAGDRMGCVHLVEMYRQKLIFECITASRMNPLDAEEIVNDVFVSVVQKIGQFSFKKTESDFHFWVMAIFRNKLRDFVRRLVVKTGQTSPRNGHVSYHEDCQDGEQNGLIQAAIRAYEKSLAEGEGLMESGNIINWMAELLDEMEPWERVLLKCRALDVPYADIAQYTGKTMKQLKVYHGRVKRKFVRLLAERHPELSESIRFETVKEKTVLSKRSAGPAR